MQKIKPTITPLTISRAIEIYATTPNIQHKQVAKELGISDKSLRKLRRSPDFNKRVYDSYDSELIDVIRAMFDEAKSGNVSAGRLLLEHGNKLQKNINVNVISPFERWLKVEESKAGIDSIEGEIIVEEVPEKLSHREQKILNKRIEWNKRRKELREWNKRAKAVGLDPLPPQRPKKSVRLAWEKKIIEREG